MNNIFNKLHHVCIVVDDLEKAITYYEGLGIGPWYDYPKHGNYIEFEVPDAKASAVMRYKCVDLDNIQLQLCEPNGDASPQGRFLKDHGPGVYHLGFEVADMKDAETKGAELGLDVIARGLRADGGGFCYYNTAEKAGTILEIRK
ncbi:VOC family protein [Bartonella sp. HY329]|uniref:VOC family protein n=1 Tax=unclassified Bartonella TaxID=2645622 RepID=UPI0021C684FF|nr:MULTISPECIES: VOC family protein [unclassified Bartonella]UXM96083.1 VOC family protein [Bartonella sp. HY329]UXN10407.1 VOC family protein [Bartonella sp. HY328]